MNAALVAYLLAQTALTALVGQRIDWLKRPQGSALPSITLQTASAPRDYGLAGRVGLTGYLVQFDIWGSSFKQTQDTLAALIPALDALTASPFQGAFIENQRESFETQEGVDAAGSTTFYRVSVDVRLWHVDA